MLPPMILLMTHERLVVELIFLGIRKRKFQFI